METLIGIVIPPDLKAEIVEFSEKYKCPVTEPHISLVPHAMLRGARGVERNLSSFCLLQPPLKTIIGGPNIETGEEIDVFFLTVIMGSLNATRDRLISHLKLPPYSGVFRPYVSLVEQKKGGAYDFDKMLSDAKLTFSKPRSISVDALAMYKRSKKHGPYTIDKIYPFTGR